MHRDLSGSVVRRIETIPSDLEGLVDASLKEGFDFVARLRDDWNAGANRFDRPGEGLFEARIEGQLVGICGLNRDPYTPEAKVARVRRMYVLPSFRRGGVGMRLVESVLKCASERFVRIRLRTETEVASRFYCSLGFTPTQGEQDSTHELVVEDRKGRPTSQCS